MSNRKRRKYGEKNNLTEGDNAAGGCDRTNGAKMLRNNLYICTYVQDFPYSLPHQLFKLICNNWARNVGRSELILENL